MIERVVTDGQWAVADGLIREYVESLGFDLCFQDIDRELAELRSEYGPPHGAAFLADEVGFVGLRRFDDEVGELKRMYVVPAARGRGVGRALATAAVEEARRLGYRRLRLDTLSSMEAAVRLYLELGFTDIPPYRENPSRARGTWSWLFSVGGAEGGSGARRGLPGPRGCVGARPPRGSRARRS